MFFQIKKVHKLIIGSFIGPFILTFFIALFILLMQFLFKYIDDLVGKGLEWYVVLQLLMYASSSPNGPAFGNSTFFDHDIRKFRRAL